MTQQENYQRILQDITETAQQSGRNPQDITLVAVSKTESVDAIRQVYQAGCKDFGENRVQEALPKMENFETDIHWHLIGTLQKNKVNKVIGKFHLIHSIDSIELAEKISEASIKAGTTTSILLEVNTSGENSKHGFTPESFKEVILPLSELPGIRLHGLMTMAPFTASEEVIRKCFADLRQLRDLYAGKLGNHPLHELSMGMSHDYKIAIQEGATILRIGTAIFKA